MLMFVKLFKLILSFALNLEVSSKGLELRERGANVTNRD